MSKIEMFTGTLDVYQKWSETIHVHMKKTCKYTSKIQYVWLMPHQEF